MTKTIEFRDGEQSVPDHVAELLKGIDTYAYTYEQAIRLSEQQLLKQRLNEAQRSLVDGFLRGRR